MPQKGYFGVLHAIAACSYRTPQLLQGYPFGSSAALQPCFLAVASPIPVGQHRNVVCRLLWQCICTTICISLYRLSTSLQVPPCCSLSKSTGRMGSLFIDINESPNHQTQTTTKLLPILACFGQHLNCLLSKKESWLTSTQRQFIGQLCLRSSALHIQR